MLALQIEKPRPRECVLLHRVTQHQGPGLSRGLAGSYTRAPSLQDQFLLVEGQLSPNLQPLGPCVDSSDPESVVPSPFPPRRGSQHWDFPGQSRFRWYGIAFCSLRGDQEQPGWPAIIAVTKAGGAMSSLTGGCRLGQDHSGIWGDSGV